MSEDLKAIDFPTRVRPRRLEHMRDRLRSELTDEDERRLQEQERAIREETRNGRV